jgi:hypothetical protein
MRRRMSVLRLWLLVSIGLFCLGLTWAFAPILIPALAITLGLGGVVAVVVLAARRLERWRLDGAKRPDGHDMQP